MVSVKGTVRTWTDGTKQENGVSATMVVDQ